MHILWTFHDKIDPRRPFKRCVQHKEIETYNQGLVYKVVPLILNFFMLLAKSLNVFEDKEEGVGP